MRMLKTNVVRLFISTVMMGFLIIYMAGGSIVEAGDKNQDLIEAVTEGRSDAVKRLLTEGADVNAIEDATDNTALMVAAHKGHINVAKTLLDKNADVNAARKLDGWTALMIAASGDDYKHYEALKLLLAYGADVNATQQEGFTAMMVAANKGELKTVKLLVGKGASVSPKGPDGRTALFMGLLIVETWKS